MPGLERGIRTASDDDRRVARRTLRKLFGELPIAGGLRICKPGDIPPDMTALQREVGLALESER